MYHGQQQHETVHDAQITLQYDKVHVYLFITEGSKDFPSDVGVARGGPES